MHVSPSSTMSGVSIASVSSPPSSWHNTANQQLALLYITHTSELTLLFLWGISPAQLLKPHVQRVEDKPCFYPADKLPNSDHTETEDFHVHYSTVKVVTKIRTVAKFTYRTEKRRWRYSACWAISSRQNYVMLTMWEKDFLIFKKKEGNANVHLLKYSCVLRPTFVFERLILA